MKTSRALIGVAGMAVTLSLLTTPALAATTSTPKPQHHMETKAIFLNQKLVSKPSGFVVGKTTYMPIWYVMQALHAAGISYLWTKTKVGYSWNITAPKTLKIDLTKISVGTGAISIYINGTLVKKVNGIVDIDPSSGGSTTYMPVWYVMDTLNRLQVKSGWNGTTWTLTPSDSSTTSSGGQKTGSGSGANGSGSNGSGSNGSGSSTTTGDASSSTTGSSSSGSSDGGSNGSGTGSASSNSSGSSNSAGSGSTTPPPPPPPPVDSTPQASSLPGMVSKGQLVSDLANALNLTSSSLPITSPYDDLPASSPYYAGDMAAIASGLATPFFTSTQSGTLSHFGAGDVVTLQEAEEFYWNYLNIHYANYQPGGSLDAWASAIGLTTGLQQGTPYLSVADEQKLIQNLTDLLNGQVMNGSTIQMRYTPHDEYTWTFSGDVDSNWNPLYSGSSIQTAILNTYAFYNAITMQVVGAYLEVTIPINSDRRWFAYVSASNGIQYSTNGGATWTSSPTFDGSTVMASGTVLVRAPLANGMSITYNNMLAQAKGSIILGWVNLSQNPAWGSGSSNGVTSSGATTTSPVTVDRVTLT